MEEELKCTWVSLLLLLSYMPARGEPCFNASSLLWTEQWWKPMQIKEVFNKIIANYKLLLRETVIKTNVYLLICPQLCVKNKFSTVWTVLVLESVHCILRIKCGEI